MAKCTDIEKQLVDEFLSSYPSDELIRKVIESRITDKQRKRLVKSFLDYKSAESEWLEARGDLFGISTGKEMADIIHQIEDEAIDSK